MLNPFPIQFLALFAYFILRVFVGSMLVYFGIRHFKNRSAITLRTPSFFTQIYVPLSACTQIATGILFVLGLFTQIAALITIFISGAALLAQTLSPSLYRMPRTTYALLLGAALSLFITGGGAFAFDLPI